MIRPKHWLKNRKLYNTAGMNLSERPPAKTYNPLEVMSPGEQTVMEIKRHPFGLIGVYLSAGLLMIGLLVGAGLTPRFAPNLSNQDKTGIFVGALALIAIVLLYLYIAVTIYRGNRWIVTSDSITQISQVGLFKKVTSQLSLANLEDVTFEQESFLQTMLGFGTLKVETAGERSKFSFAFCPNPADCARRIITAHEQFIAARPENMEEANRGTVEAQAFNRQSYPEPGSPTSQPSQSPIPGNPSPADPTKSAKPADDEYDVPN